jgi:hypothetical protein
MAKAKSPTQETQAQEIVAQQGVDASTALVNALIQAIQATKPVEKKTAYSRKANTPWTPKDGSAKTKLKRDIYQHSLKLDPDMLSNDEVAVLNKLRPGRYLDQWVVVTKRRDGGINITYPVKTASQRMKLASQYGITSLKALVERCNEESANPKKYAKPSDLDDFE